MASIRKRGENSYLLVVSRGYDYQGNRLKPAQKTVHPPLGLTAKQTQKWLNEQAVLYEQEVRHTPGQPVDSYLSFSLEDEAHIRRQAMAGMVRGSAGKLIRAKGSTAYGVAAAASRLVQAIIHDTRDILTVSVELGGAYGKNGLAISVPCIVDRQGARVAAELPMSEDERQAFDASADVVAAITKNFIEKGSDGNDEIQ